MTSKRAGTWYAPPAAATRGGCGARRMQGRLRLWLCVAAVLAVSPAGAGVMSQAQRGDLQQRYNWMPKSELLAWINGLLQVEYTKIEQCANGAAYCQVLDSLFLDEFPLKRVSFTAKAEHESIKNYKILQQFFMRKGITKTVDVERMIKGRPMDNLEFLQWLRGFFEVTLSCIRQPRSRPRLNKCGRRLACPEHMHMCPRIPAGVR